MNCHFQWKQYKREFRVPVKTAYGERQLREGIIIRVETENGDYAFGECSPLEGFSPDDFKDAVDYISTLPRTIELSEVFLLKIPARLLSVQSAFNFCLFHLQGTYAGAVSNTGYLGMVEEWENRMSDFAEFDTVKLKVGVGSVESEVKEFRRLMDHLKRPLKFRLDANCVLKKKEFDKWLPLLELNEVEFLEQPFQQTHLTFSNSEELTRKLALDEEIGCWSEAMCFNETGWLGYYVAKPLIMGNFRQDLWGMKNFMDRLIFSSSLETAFGAESVLQMVYFFEYAKMKNVGFGTSDLFTEDAVGSKGLGPRIERSGYPREELQNLWEAM